MALFYLSPSRIARYFFHECERHLRYHATPRARAAAEGVPAVAFDRNPITAAIFEGGYRLMEAAARNVVAAAPLAAMNTVEPAANANTSPDAMTYAAAPPVATTTRPPTVRTAHFCPWVKSFQNLIVDCSSQRHVTL